MDERTGGIGGKRLGSGPTTMTQRELVGKTPGLASHLSADVSISWIRWN